jgi:hypothetical protein
MNGREKLTAPCFPLRNPTSGDFHRDFYRNAKEFYTVSGYMYMLFPVHGKNSGENSGHSCAEP